MSPIDSLQRFTHDHPLAVELIAAVTALALGAFLLPVCIFYAGSAALGRYDGASVGRIYSTVFAGLGQGSIAAWIVLLGPYGLYLLYRSLRVWWRAGANT